MVRSNGTRIVVCGLHKDDHLLEREVPHCYPAPLGLVSAAGEKKAAENQELQEGEFAQPPLALTSKTSRRVANLHKRQQASAITIRAKDFMATKGLGEQAIVMPSQNIEQAVEVEIFMV